MNKEITKYEQMIVDHTDEPLDRKTADAIEDVINSEYNNISVWDLTFYRLDDDGNELKDKNGKTIIYTSYKVDCSYLTDGLEVEDLVPEDKPNPYPYASIIEEKYES